MTFRLWRCLHWKFVILGTPSINEFFLTITMMMLMISVMVRGDYKQVKALVLSPSNKFEVWQWSICQQEHILLIMNFCDHVADLTDILMKWGMWWIQWKCDEYDLNSDVKNFGDDDKEEDETDKKKIYEKIKRSKNSPFYLLPFSIYSFE